MHQVISLTSALLALLMALSAQAAPTLVGKIDPSPGMEPEVEILNCYDPLTNRIFGYGVSPLNNQGQRLVAINATTRLVEATFQMPNLHDVEIALDSAGGKLYALDYGGGGASKILVLSTANLTQIGSFTLPFTSGAHIAIHPGAQKAFAQNHNGNMVEVNLATGATRTIASPFDDEDNIVVNPQKNRLYCYFDGYISGEYRSEVWAIDTGSGTVAATVPLPGAFQFYHVAVSETGDRFFVLGTNSVNGQTVGQLLIVDATSNTIIGSPINLGLDLRFARHDAASNSLYLSGYGATYQQQAVWKLNLATNVATPLLQYAQQQFMPCTFAYDSSAQTIHALADTLPQVRTVHVNTLATDGYEVHYEPYAVAVDPSTDRVYSADSFAGDLLVANGTTRAVVARIPVGGTFGRTPKSSVAVNSSTQRVYVACGERTATSNGYNTFVGVVNAATNQVITRIPLETNHVSGVGVTIAVDEAADLTFASYHDNDSTYKLAVIDGRASSANKDTILKTLTLPIEVYAMAFNRANKRLYMAGPSNSGGLMVLDTTNILSGNPAVAVSGPTFGRPGAVAVNPVTNRVYISDNYSLTVQVFDGATNGKIGSFSINTPENPYPDGIFGLAVDSTTNRIYVTDHGNYLQGTLSVVNGADNAITTLSLVVGNTPYQVAVNETTHQVYVANADGGDIAVVDDGPPPSITTSAFPFKGGVFDIKDARGAVTFAVVGNGGTLSQLLPTGQTLMPAGVVVGIAEPGTYTVTVRVSEVGNPARFADRTYTFTVPGRVNPISIEVREVDGSEFVQGKLVTYEWTLTNTGTTTAQKVMFKIEPPLGFALQSGVSAPFFVDATGQPSGAPIDPITKRQVTLPGSKTNPKLDLGADGFQVATFAVGNMLAGGKQKLRATFRIAYDYPVGPDAIFNHAKVSLGTKVGQYVEKQMTALSLQIAAAAPGAAKPKLSVEVTQLGAGVVYEKGVAVATVGRGRTLVDGSVPSRRQNQLIYRVTYRNSGDAPTGFLRALIPVPSGTTFTKNSAKVDDVKVANPKIEKLIDDTQLVLTIPGLAANSAKTIQFTVDLKGSLKPGARLSQPGALVFSFEILQPGVAQDELLAKVVNDSVMHGQVFGDPIDYSQPAKEVSDALFFHNAGGLDASTVTIKYKIPAGAIYVDSFLADVTGKKLGLSEKEQAVFRSQGRLGYDSVIQANGEITFRAGKRVKGKAGLVVPSRGAGFARVVLKPDPANKPGNGRTTAEWRASDTKGQFVPAPFPPTNPTLVRAPRKPMRAPIAAAAVTLPTAAELTQHLHRGPNDAKTFIVVDAPTFGKLGDNIVYRITWGRLADTKQREPGGETDELGFELPEGIQFVSASTSQSFGVSPVPADLTFLEAFNRIDWQGNLEPSSVHTATINAKVIAFPGQRVLAPICVLNSLAGPIFAQTREMVVLDPFQVDKRPLLLKYALGPAGAAALGSSTRPNPAFLAAAAAVSETSRNLTVTGADFAQVTTAGVLVIPIGATRLVAAGGGNLTAQSGAMIAAGGGNLVAAGGGNLINISVGGQSRTGTQVLDDVPALVNAGGMNLVAAGAGNLVGNDGSTLVGNDGASLVGMDGSTLVGNDGSTIRGRFKFPADGAPAFYQPLVNGSPSGAPIPLPFAYGNLVAAGGGNLVAAGGGHILAAGSRGNLVGLDGGSLVGLDGGSLVGNDGASLVGMDGSTLKSPRDLVDFNIGNLVGNDGSTLVGNDGASLVGMDGSTFQLETAARLVGNDGSTVSLANDGLFLSGSSGAPVPEF